MRSIISIIFIVAAGAIFFMYTQPTYDTVQTLNAQVGQYDEALQKATELQTIKQSLLARYNTFDPGNIDRLQKLLPDHVDNVRLILDIDSLAGKHGMALQNVAVSAAQSAQGKETAVGSIGSAKQKYDSRTLKFTTQGSYSTFRAFLADLESSLRIVDLASLSLARAPDAGGSDNYTYDIMLRTYWLK